MRKFNPLVRAKYNRGDPYCPWQVRAAKTLLSSIRTRTELETESYIENIDSSGTEDDDLLIKPMKSPIFEVSKIGKIDNPEIINVDKTKTGTVAHTTSKKKRKSLRKVSKAINFDDIPLDSSPKVGRKLIHRHNESTDKIDLMLEYMRLRDIRMEDDNHKRLMEKKEAKKEEKERQ